MSNPIILRPLTQVFFDLAEQTLSRVSYKSWHFHVEAGERPWLQVEFIAPDPMTGQPVLQKGRKWMLSVHMTGSEIVQTALKAVLAAEEHEAREHFLYRGYPVFGPHFNVEVLADLCERGGFERRPAAPSSDLSKQ